MSSSDGDSGSDDEGEEAPWWKSPDPEPPSIGPEPPSVDVPEPDAPAGGADVEPGVVGSFWRLVVVFDVALLALALGPMFVYFEGDWRRGGMLFALGVAAFVYGVAQYRRFRAEDPSAEDSSADGGASTGDSSTDEGSSTGDSGAVDEA